MPTSLEHASARAGASAHTFTPATVAEVPLADYRPWPPGLPEAGRERDSGSAVLGELARMLCLERVRELLRGPRGFCG